MQKSGEFAQILKEFLMEEAKSRGRSISFGEDGRPNQITLLHFFLAVEVKEVLAKLEQIVPDAKEKELKPEEAKSNRLSPNGNTLVQTSSITTKTNQQANNTTTAAAGIFSLRFYNLPTFQQIHALA